LGAGREERARGRSPMPEEEGSAAPVDAGDTAASWVMFGVGYPLSCAFVGLVTHRVALAYNPQSIKAAGGAITQLTCVASLSLKKPSHSEAGARRAAPAARRTPPHTPHSRVAPDRRPDPRLPSAPQEPARADRGLGGHRRRRRHLHNVDRQNSA